MSLLWDSLSTLPARGLLLARSAHPVWKQVGLDLRRFRDSARATFADREVLWCHGASIGEIKCLAPIIHAFLHESICRRVLLTYTSPDALREIQRHLIPQSEHIVTCPLIAAGVGPLERCLDSVRLKLCVIAEQDFWPRMVAIAQKKGVPLMIVDGRFKPLRRGPLGWMRRRLYSMVADACAAVCVATEKEYDAAARYVSKDRLVLTGPSKAIEAVERSGCAHQRRREYLNLFGMTQRHPILVAGNLASDEIALMIQTITHLFERFPDAGAVIAPRYTRKPKLMRSVVQQLRQAGLAYETLSSLLASAKSHGQARRAARVVLVDRTGYLADIYAVGDAAVVGGSFFSKGGHNFFEPVAMNVPTLCGRGAANWEGVAERFATSDGIIRTDPDNLYDAVLEVLSDRCAAMRRCERASDVLATLAEEAKRNALVAKGLVASAGAKE